MNNISFIGTCSFRTYFYLKALKNANINLQNIIIYDYKNLDLSEFKNKKITYKKFEIIIDESLDSLLRFFNAIVLRDSSINTLEEQIQNIQSDFFIFSGNGGEIVKENILNLNNFLHIHPGKLPSYRGSTTIYYSLLKESQCYATAFFLANKIDTGNVIKQMKFDLLDINFDYLYDPFIRAFLLIETLKDTPLKSQKQENENEKDYYIIHPVLKKLALLKKERLLKNEKNI